jgi:hypothetical protein
MLDLQHGPSGPYLYTDEQLIEWSDEPLRARWLPLGSTLVLGHGVDEHDEPGSGIVRGVPDEATVRGRSNILGGVAVAIFPLILVSAPVGTGLTRGVWVQFWLGVIALVIVRAARMSVRAGPSGLVVRNFGRDYRVPWSDVTAIEAARSDNITGAVTTILIRRADGSKLIGRGASSYSRRAVERWRDQLVAVRDHHA